MDKNSEKKKIPTQMKTDGKLYLKVEITRRKKLSNGHSPANFSNSSTRRKLAIFVEFEYSPKWSFLKIGRTLYIRQHSPTCLGRTRYIRPTFANHFPRTQYIRERQIWRLLHEFSEFGEFGEFSECRLVGFIHIKYVICA